MNDISLSYLFKLALKRIWIIILAAIVFGAASFCYFNFAVDSKYKSTGSILVTNGALSTQEGYNSSKISGTDVSASLAISHTVIDILGTPDLFKQLANEFDNKYTYTELKNSCSIVRRNDDTLFIDVSFTSTNREEAKDLVNVYLSLAPRYMVKGLPGSEVSMTVETDKATKVYPNTYLYTLICAILGAVLAFVITLILDSLDNTIKGEEYFTSHFDVPLLGSIPDFENYGIASYANNKGGQDNAYK